MLYALTTVLLGFSSKIQYFIILIFCLRGSKSASSIHYYDLLSSGGFFSVVICRHSRILGSDELCIWIIIFSPCRICQSIWNVIHYHFTPCIFPIQFVMFQNTSIVLVGGWLTILKFCDLFPHTVRICIPEGWEYEYWFQRVNGFSLCIYNSFSSQ